MPGGDPKSKRELSADKAGSSFKLLYNATNVKLKKMVLKEAHR